MKGAAAEASGCPPLGTRPHAAAPAAPATPGDGAPGAGGRHARSLMRRARRHLGRVALLLLGSTAHAATGSVQVQRVDAGLHVQASATVPADTQTVWRTLVGYDRLPDFIPDMQSSRTLQRDGDDAVVEQRGRAGLGPFHVDFALTLAVHELPMQSVTATALGGDFSRFDSSYRIRAIDAGDTRIDYDAVIAPKSGIPPFIGAPVMALAIRRQFDALVAEIDRRASAPH